MKLLISEVQAVLHIDDDHQTVSWAPMNLGWEKEFNGEDFVLNSECWITVQNVTGTKIFSVDFPHYYYKDDEGWACEIYKRLPFMLQVENSNEWESFKVEI